MQDHHVFDSMEDLGVSQAVFPGTILDLHGVMIT
jgi:hypothetical protein